MSIAFAVCGDMRPLEMACFFKRCEILVVETPEATPQSVDILRVFELSEEKCGDNFGGEIAATDVDPGVLIDLPTKEF